MEGQDLPPPQELTTRVPSEVRCALPRRARREAPGRIVGPGLLGQDCRVRLAGSERLSHEPPG